MEREYSSVLTERPGAERKWTPEMTTIVLGAMLLCVVAAACLKLSNWVSKKIERGASSGADDLGSIGNPVRDDNS